jgi:two-component system LytT family response regulator
MPGGSGFDLLAALDEVPQVIFTTAFDTYALKAFEVNALDFLQKPIRADRLAIALERAREQIARSRSRSEALEKIFIKDGTRCWFVALRDILLFESEGNYTRVYFGGERPLMLRSLNQLEQRLDAGRFFRANRRQIVNLDFIARIDTAPSEGLVLVLGDGLRVELSRRRAVEFRSRNSL